MIGNKKVTASMENLIYSSEGAMDFLGRLISKMTGSKEMKMSDYEKGDLEKFLEKTILDDKWLAKQPDNSIEVTAKDFPVLYFLSGEDIASGFKDLIAFNKVFMEQINEITKKNRELVKDASLKVDKLIPYSRDNFSDVEIPEEYESQIEDIIEKLEEEQEKIVQPLYKKLEKFKNVKISNFLKVTVSVDASDIKIEYDVIKEPPPFSLNKLDMRTLISNIKNNWLALGYGESSIIANTDLFEPDLYAPDGSTDINDYIADMDYFGHGYNGDWFLSEKFYQNRIKDNYPEAKFKTIDILKKLFP